MATGRLAAEAGHSRHRARHHLQRGVLPSSNCPRRVLVVGGGYIAVEFASIFHGLGSQTSLLYRGELFLRGFDMAVRIHLQDELSNRASTCSSTAISSASTRQADGSLLASLHDGRQVATDAVFYATGRRPMLDNLGLENTQVALDERGSCTGR